MIVVITESIRRKEFGRGLIAQSVLDTILRSYGEGICITIKGHSLPKKSRLIKLYATTIEGARRLVFLVDVETTTGFLLFYRSKNDSVGKNISIKNPEFKRQLLRYLDLLRSDIIVGRHVSYDTK